MAHLRELTVYKCFCGAPAKVELFNKHNAAMGRYCKRHGDIEQRILQKREDTRDQLTSPR